MNNFMLQNFVESDTLGIKSDSIKQHKSQKAGHQELQLLIGTTYNQICQLVEQVSFDFQIPQGNIKAQEKLALIKQIVTHLVENVGPMQTKNKINESGVITCGDCQNYQANLQKLENEVRQHIRLEQQLKIYQDSMEEKIEEFKKERKDYEKKIETQKKIMDELKSVNSTLNEKLIKVQSQNQKLKAELRHFKTGSGELLSSKREHRQTGYESKENKIDWGHRHISIKKDEKVERKDERRSIQKRSDSGQKWKVNSNAKSTKMISLMNEKLILEKNKEERKKAIQSKFQYRK